MSASKSAQTYVCDTIPPPRWYNQPVEDQDEDYEHKLATAPSAIFQEQEQEQEDDPSIPCKDSIPLLQGTPPRKLCARHLRMADEGMNLKLQQQLDALPLPEREAVNAVWSNFSGSSHPQRALILQGLLTMCCFSQLSLLSDQLAHLIRLDPFTVLPREVCLQVLAKLDPTSLCRAAQVGRHWKTLADDDILWRGICEQHIGQKCRKCGWGLPVLEKKRINALSPKPKRPLDESLDDSSRPMKRQRSEGLSPDSDSIHANVRPPLSSALSQPLASCPISSPSPCLTRPWKDVFSERLTIERNWRRGRYTVRTIKGHTDGILCLQYSETLSHPSYPILMTGSYDCTARVWNLETGVELQCLKGHTRAVRALQFDECKLITGSMDHTIRVWDWRKGKCIRTLTGHSEGVVCLHFDANVLASGSVDTTIKIWNLRKQEAFTLRGHTDWVNAVQLWDSCPSAESKQSSLNPCGAAAAQIDPGKMLFSASDDGTIRLWDLTLRTCIRQFTGHVAQVQSMRFFIPDRCDDDPTVDGTSKKPARPTLVSGSLDNTIKVWDIETGEAVTTLFGHIEGVWSVVSDKLRTVSASHDRTIKVWSREEGRCTATLVGHRGGVTCLALGEDKIISGGDDWDIKVWSFAD